MKILTLLLLVLALALGVVSSSNADSRIVGGEIADPADWPSQFALVEKGKSAAAGQFCGGTLVAPEWIATAAHCVMGAASQNIDVVHGADLRVEEERLGVSEIVVHPSYYKQGPNGLDLALLRTTAPSVQTPTPVVSSSERSSWLPFRTVATAGWGMLKISWAVRPMMLRDVRVRVIADSYCSAPRVYGAFFVRKTMLCAGVAGGGKDSCYGDSGGPLMSYVAGQPRLAGIVSWGGKGLTGGCASPRYPGVYSRIAPFADWIVGKTGTSLGR